MKHTFKASTRLLMTIVVLALSLYGTQVARAETSEHSRRNSPMLDAGTTWYVAVNGEDTNYCSDPALPCKTFQKAYENASDGDTIKFAEGVHGFPSGTSYYLQKELNISGGWNPTFSAQTGFTTIDGNGTGYVIFTVMKKATLERLLLKNAGGGVEVSNLIGCPSRTLPPISATLNQVSITGMRYYAVQNCEMLVINNSTISNNLGRSAVKNNSTTIIQNSTIANNTNDSGSDDAGGLYSSMGTIYIKNSIVSANFVKQTPRDCSGTIVSDGNNLIDTIDGCSITLQSSDQVGIDPKIGFLLPEGYIPLSPNSPAVDAGDPAACPLTDQRGVLRPQGGSCDIGAYEYSAPGSVTTFRLAYGNNQRIGPGFVFNSPLAVYALDAQGTPVDNLYVTFTAPDSGPSGIFPASGTNMITVPTDELGMAIVNVAANSQLGPYNVSVSTPSLPNTLNFDLTNGGWFVSPNGNDTNSCAAPDQPCLTINAAITKATVGDSIQIAGGVYTSASTYEVVLVNKGVILSGGWNSDFTVQDETTIIDGQGARRGITVSAPLQTITIDRFTIQNGYSYEGGGISVKYQTSANIKNSIIQKNSAGVSDSWSAGGGGISNRGDSVVLENSMVTENKIIGAYEGSGIYAGGKFTINNSVIDKNTGSVGIRVAGELTMNNSIVSENSQGGIQVTFSKATIDHSTITGNSGYGGIFGNSPYEYSGYSGTVIMQNSILAGNKETILGGDCYSAITSNGYNIIGNDTACTIIPAVGDLIGTSANPINPMMSIVPMKPYGHFALLAGSPAIDAANPSTCPATDQRGVARPQGANCDIGAYEYGVTPGPAAYFELYSGNNQSNYQGKNFAEPLIAYVVDSQGTPVENINVTFTAPASVVGGKFTSTFSNSVMIQTDINGLAITPIFRANYGIGNYMVTAQTSELPNQVDFSLTNLEVVANYLQNGNFEDAVLGNHWWQYSMQFGTPLCKFATCGNGGGIVGPHSGSTWAWFGRVHFPYTEAAALYQNIIIPSSPSPVYLRFYLWVGSNDPYGSGNSEFFASVDDSEGRLFVAKPNQQSLYPSYKMVTVDISKYADGKEHNIILRGIIAAERVNYSVDDISVNVATFGDVFSDYWSWQYIDRLYNSGITGGCSSSPMMYCPGTYVNRAQMAVFLLRGEHGSAYTPPAASGTMFSDIPANYWAAAWIEQLATEGITGGCGSGKYCPEVVVTRDQMAVFLLRGEHGGVYVPPTATGVFSDVPANYWAADWIEQLAAEGITGGCAAGSYCPATPVTRDQMAVFLVRAFNLP